MRSFQRVLRVVVLSLIWRRFHLKWLAFVIGTTLISACARANMSLPQPYSVDPGTVLVSGVEIHGTFVPAGLPVPIPVVQLIHMAATSSTRSELSRKIQEMWGGWAPETALRDKVVEELNKRGKKAAADPEIVHLPQSIKDEVGPRSENIAAAKLWYNPDRAIFDHTQGVEKFRPTVIIEAGYDSFYLENDGGVVGVIIKVIDAQTQVTIGRRRTIGFFKTDRTYNLKDSSQLQKYCASVTIGFNAMLAIEVPQMLTDIGF